MIRNRLLVAAALLFLANALTAWWVKGDLEMAWLVGGPMILGGGILYGAIAAFFLRHTAGRAALIFFASCAWSLALAAIAVSTPHGWEGAPPQAMKRAAERFAGDPAALKAAAEKITNYPVEPARAVVRYTPSWTGKIGFSFAVERRPAEARVSFGFDVGPADAFEFRVAPSGPGWRLVSVRARTWPIILRREAFERRYPGIPLVEAGGSGPYSPGDLVPVELARSETDWEIAILRIAAGGRPLEELRRYSRADIAAGLDSAAARAGLGRIESIHIYFRPVGTQDVMFAAGPAFRFIVRLQSPRYAMAMMQVRLSAGALSFEVERAIRRS